jgi:hypothetical protein
VKKWYVRVSTTVSYDLKYVHPNNINPPLVETFMGKTSDNWITVFAKTSRDAEDNAIDGIDICCEPLWAPRVREKNGILVIYVLEPACRAG